MTFTVFLVSRDYELVKLSSNLGSRNSTVSPLILLGIFSFLWVLMLGLSYL